MRAILLVVFISFACLSTNAQTRIELDNVKQHIGDSVTVCGKVFSGRYLSNSANTPTFLNVGENYPNQKLTVVIWGDVRTKFEGKPEEIYKDKNICISGKIELYNGRPQIVIRKTEQIILQK